MPDAATPLSSFPDDLQGAYPGADLLWAVLETSLTGLALYAPLWDAEGRLTDFRIDLLNPAAQRILAQPSRPSGTYLQHYPHTLETGVFAFHREAFATGEPARMNVNYQGDGLDNYFHLAARRVGQGLLVSFTDTADQPRTPVEVALRKQQAQQAQARAAAEAALRQTEQLREAEVQNLNEELGAINEELLASNEELLTSNAALTRTQAQLRQLNQELEARVQAQTQDMRQAQAATEAQRQLLHDVLHQAPVAIAYLDGADYRIRVANPAVCEIWDRSEAQLLSRPLLDALPELQGQGVDTLLDSVLYSGVPYHGTELPFQLQRHGQLETIYFDFVYQPQRSPQGETTGVLVVATDVTAQVQAHQRFAAQEQHTAQLNEELATINEELTAANEEIRANNDALQYTEAELRALNEELETRVQQRTAEAQQAHAEAEAERATLLRTFTQAPVAIGILTGPEYVVAFANDSMGGIWGRPTASVIGRPHFEALPDLVGQGLETVFYDVFHNEKPYHQYEELVRIDRAGTGELVPGYFDIVYQPLRTAEGEVTSIICVASEVTAQVQARQQVQLLNEQLTTALQEAQRQRQRLEAFIMQAPALLCVFDGPDFVFDLVNPPYQELFAGRPLLGLPLREALPDLADAGTLPLLEQVYHTGQPFEATEQLVPVRRMLGGPVEERYYNLLYQARRDTRGEVDGLLVFVTDVTEQVRARQQVQQLNEELQASNASLNHINQQLTRTNADLDNFVYTASHDLKAPISNIEGLLLLLRNDLLHDEEVAPVLSRMQEAVERFKHTIGHLTDVSKLQLEFNRPAEATPLEPLLEGVRQDLAPLVAQTGGQLEVKLADCPTLFISEKNLRSILYNLLSNALKYHHPDRPPIVRISCRLEGDQHVLQVQDNGLGLSVGQQGKLFGLFQRLHTHVEGTGVGLYMVKKIVENAGGTLTVESQEGVGSTFLVALPATAV